MTLSGFDLAALDTALDMLGGADVDLIAQALQLAREARERLDALEGGQVHTREEAARALGLTVGQVDHTERRLFAKVRRILKRNGFDGDEPLLGSFLHLLLSEHSDQQDIDHLLRQASSIQKK
ncbi:hypothetical protein VVD49_11825 [Uliginosibacterium sp. H3]|uniref:RNA polymerase sigma-70 region 4 domain-containing protein n=1 Tax=Uliginosibacterium silvisoli TaxID=3114758 RepID=A0ABU6K602_9RHOO|nr:hypothetical protein [Uliginosibacterium sp. H3]